MKYYYLIVSNDSLQTAYFCGAPKEITNILGMSRKSFHNAVKRKSVIKKFNCKIEKVLNPDVRFGKW